MTVDFNPHYSYFNDDSIVLKLKDIQGPFTSDFTADFNPL